MSSSKHGTCGFSIPTKLRKRSLNLKHIQTDSPDNLRYILQKPRKILSQRIRRYRFHWQSTASLNRSRLQNRRRAALGMILLYSIKTKKALPIQMSQEDYNVAVKVLGGEFCDFLVDTGTIGGKPPIKRATVMYNMDPKHTTMKSEACYLLKG